jgi:hypothetical protein
VSSRTRAALAGAVAACTWGALEPLDQRLFRSDYSDIRLVGRGDRRLGFLVHAFNGALFGVAYDSVRQRVDVDQRRLALGMALAENTVLWPLMLVVNRELAESPRAFTQSTLRHALFGWLLGRLA